MSEGAGPGKTTKRGPGVVSDYYDVCMSLLGNGSGMSRAKQIVEHARSMVCNKIIYMLIAKSAK